LKQYRQIENTQTDFVVKKLALFHLKLVHLYLKLTKLSNSSDRIHNPEEYMNMIDCILHQIESSKAPELENAKANIRRLRTLDLYKFVNEQQMSMALKVTENDILAYQVPNHVQLKREDVIIHDLNQLCYERLRSSETL
jgi:hypothetical protein